jgi:DNA polymerase III delta prime subunit
MIHSASTLTNLESTTGYWTGGGGGGGYHGHGNHGHKGRRGGKGGTQAGAKADSDANWRGAEEGQENGNHHNAQSSNRNAGQPAVQQAESQATQVTANFACQDIRYIPDAQQDPHQQHVQPKAKAHHRGGRQRGKGGRGKGGQHATDDDDHEGYDDHEVCNAEYGGSAASNQGVSQTSGFALPPPGTHTNSHVGAPVQPTQQTSGLMPLPPLGSRTAGPIQPSPSASSPTAEDDWEQMDSASPYDMGSGFSGLQQMVYSTPEQTQAALAALQAAQAAALQPTNPNAKINQALNAKIRKSLLKYEETLDIEELGAACAAFDASTSAGEGCCDASTLTLLLVNLTRVNKLANAHKVLDAAVADKVFLEPVNIIAIATSVSQRSQSHKALRYLRRLIYECLGDDFGQEQTIFFDRHVSFIFSELMAEADGCFARMENRDPHVLVHLGHAELDVQMDWKKSTGTSMNLFNRGDDKSKKIYIPSVSGMGFQRTDSCLMSFDISNPEVQKSVGLDYDRIRDGAEVEVYLSSTGPTNQAPLSVRLTSPAKVPFRENMFYRLDRLASRDQTRRMLDSLKVILRKPQDPYAVVVDPLSTLQPNQSLRELLLVPIDTTLSKVGKAHLADLEMDFTNDKAKAAALKSFREEAKHALSHLLNKSQIEALLYSCSRRLTLIQGPPGTGKTTTAVQVVTALVQYGLVDLPMLVTADSNTAVDNLVKGIAKRGLNVVRVGRPEAIREDVKQYSLDGRWKELKKAEVVCATCIGASGTTLDKIRFATVLVDECTQAAESAALVPMARGCQQVILLGDQCQLPPTVLSDVAETENLGESLFTRLVTQGVRPVLLDTQYRMHPLIAEFASAAFYNGRLQNGVSHIHRKPPEGFPWPQRQMPVAFVNLERGEEKREGSSYINVLEAEKTLWALQEVCKNDVLGPEDVGIVTPYKGQVNFIKKLIRERIGLTRFRSGLEVESVDGFQGQEKEVIIFCAVRNNREGKVGFLSDWRRLNVMLTRARRGCIVIGSKSTLVNDPLWQQWLLWASARGAICGESAKGTWVPKYLVDDRDGVWTIKSSITDEAKTGMSASALVNASKPPDQQEVVVDSWEDMGSPQLTPAAPQSRSPLALDLLEDAMQSDAEDGSAQPEVKTRAQELREERLQQDEEVIERLKDLQVGSPTFARNTSGTPPLRPTAIGGTGDDEMRTSRSPTLGPRSPQRQLAMARLGLLDDAEAEELSR